MALPAESFKQIYKNPISQVSKLLENNHGKNYLVVNLGEYIYNKELFNNNVIDVKWKDHHPP